MYNIVTLLLTFLVNMTLIAKQNDIAEEDPWPTYGYVGLGVIVLVIVVVVLIRKQYRKFNE
ncbi:hypothetical protein [Parapedobacter tibetensis]|uniref:hypothetical protein n=1 Tax=Parapedobacter tibetensis TaxID=2972951 RepID=UPI00214DAF06|nr:hypothetical protein [Parapedobacter tibetensis]